MFRGGGATKKKTEVSVNEAAISSLFDTYADPDDSDSMNMEGISKLSEELGIDPSSDVRILVLTWQLGATSKPGNISRQEFLDGMKKMKKDSFAGIMELLPTLDPGFLERSQFRGEDVQSYKKQYSCIVMLFSAYTEFYKFVFQFSREGTHKTIGKLHLLLLK